MNKLVILSICSVGAVMLLLGAAQQADAAAYMKLGDIKGESTDAGHKDWIDLFSISHEIDRTTKNTAAARQRSSVTFGDVVVVKEVDTSTPKLQESIAKGNKITTAEIDFTRSSDDGRQVTYLKYELKNVMISSYSFHGESSGDQIPTDQISLNFEEIKVTYYPKNSEGTSGKVEYSWKVEKGEK